MAPTRPQPRLRSTSTRPSTEPKRSRSRSRSQSKTTRYAHLAPHTTHISRTKILKTWKPLPLSTQDRIRQVLLDVREESKARRRRALPKPKNGIAKKAKIGIDGGRAGAREVVESEDWEGAVDDVVEKLISRLPRMPFPLQHSHSSAKTASTPYPAVSQTTSKSTAASTDLDLSLERTLSRTSLLRATLSSNNQSIKLLKAQIKREDKALKRDKGELKGLEEGVRRGREVAARQRRELHPVARDMFDGDEEDRAGCGRTGGEQDGEILDSLIPTTARTRRRKEHLALTNEAINKDEDLAPLVKQLRSHLGSMQNNVAGLEDLRSTMDNAEMTVMRFNARISGA